MDSLPVPPPGEYENIPFHDYLRWDAPSKSSLMAILSSPLHYAEARNGLGIEPTDEMVLGAAGHVALLEPEKMLARVVKYDGARRYGGDWESFKAANRSKHILTKSMYERLTRIVKAVRGSKLARPYIARLDRFEISAVGDVFGTICKGRLDADGPGIIVDLKTCRSCDKYDFARSAYSLGYHVQAALYSELVPDKEFITIAVENQAPHDVAVFKYEPEFLKRGRETVLECIQFYQTHSEINFWPGRYNELVTLKLPEWATKADADEITIGGEQAYE